MSSSDAVEYKCPVCGRFNTYQSKAGPCRMGSFTLWTAPLVVIADINEEGEQGRLRCKYCNADLVIPVHFTVGSPMLRSWLKEGEAT